MPFKFARFVFICMIAIAGSCSLYRNHRASEPANVLEMESRLVRAGFRRVPIETSDQHGAVAQLPLYRLNRYQSAEGSVFWYADPTVCSCLYEGDLKAYQTYAGLLQQEHDTAEYINDAEPEQVAYLSPFGYAFPPPVLFGEWPMFVPGHGPIHYRGGGGGGVTTHGGGGGGGVFSHPHGSGHSIGGHSGGHGHH